MQVNTRIQVYKVNDEVFFGLWPKDSDGYNPLSFKLHRLFGHHCTAATQGGYTYAMLHLVVENNQEVHVPLYIVQSLNGISIDWQNVEDPLDSSLDTDGTIQASIVNSINSIIKA